jgi:hypothetical protein
MKTTKPAVHYLASLVAIAWCLTTGCQTHTQEIGGQAQCDFFVLITNQ